MFTAKVVRTFIGSPGDVRERNVVREALGQWNAKRSSPTNDVAFVPVSWETHAFPDLSAPGQPLIDKRLVQSSDLCIALFWMKPGGSLGGGASGTVHEIEQFRTANKRVMAYFCQDKISRRDAVAYRDEITAVENLRSQMQDIGLVGEYKRAADLKSQLLDALDDVAREIVGS
ncbi:hypothetical protein ACFWDQ_15260 [Streptomyces sp. NPDC060053]|uniref:hypothetical protein n=1 Tax=Streptomyces sp. NPDC060053 TaxID=3347047 RepID=UPI0036B762D4